MKSYLNLIPILARVRRRHGTCHGAAGFCELSAAQSASNADITITDEAGVTGINYDLFSEDGLSHGRVSVIASDEIFVRLTGITDYALVMIQTTGDATDEDVAAISGILGEAFRK